MKKFDKDGNGELSDDEKAAARKHFESLRGGERRPQGDRPSRPSKEELLKKFDKDGDGQLSDDEKAAARKAYQSQRSKDAPKQDKKRRSDKKDDSNK